MNALARWALSVTLLSLIPQPVAAQFFIVPQVNTDLPVGTAQEYASSRIGYGVQAGYQLTPRWDVVASFDLYRFDVSASLDELIDGGSSILDFLNLPSALSVDMNAHTWSGGVRYSVPYKVLSDRGIIPFIGLSASTNRLTVEGLGISISQRYWGLAPIIGTELLLSDYWGIQMDVRLQTIFIDDIPFVQEVVKEHLVFIPVQLGVVYHIGQ